ncbi:MAG: hypothetical protein IJI57_09325 [Flexilinea sp.]|nr:hypothetical protein [Flexilinea sp.]
MALQFSKEQKEWKDDMRIAKTMIRNKKNFFLFFIILLFTLSGCQNMPKSRTAFETSKDAYHSINAANEMVQLFAEDVYDAWLMGIYDDDEIKKDGLSHMKWKLNIGLFLEEGAALYFYEDDWNNLSDEDKKSKLAGADSTVDETEALFNYLVGNYNGSDEKSALLKKAEDRFNSRVKYSDDSIFSYCVNVVCSAYKAMGKSDEIQNLLSDAKIHMKRISEKYSDYEHYPMLKQYYNTVSSLFDFSQNPSGSFEQMKTTIEEYRRKIRDCKNDLDYLFLDD